MAQLHRHVQGTGAPPDLPERPEEPEDGVTAIEHAVVQAVLRSSLELHGALSMLGDGFAAERLRRALECMDEAINDVRRTAAQRAADDAR